MDLRLFLASASRLILGKSTFSFWAGYFSSATTEMHMPVEHQPLNGPKIPMVYDDERYTFHDPSAGEWFGKIQGGQLRYQLQQQIDMQDDGT